MDAFGIGAALKGAQQVYFMAARRTGRTTALLEGLKPGDRVVCTNGQTMMRYKNMLEELGIEKVNLVVVSIDRPQDLFEKPPSEGRTLFDHTWLEMFYTKQLHEISCYIDKLQRESSGFGMAHVETKLVAREIAKWRI